MAFDSSKGLAGFFSAAKDGKEEVNGAVAGFLSAKEMGVLFARAVGVGLLAAVTGAFVLVSSLTLSSSSKSEKSESTAGFDGFLASSLVLDPVETLIAGGLTGEEAV